MAKENIEVLIEGGKATAAPPLGPALGPMGVNIGQVVTDINTATENFQGMQVPVTVIVDTETKEYDIKIGTPPASALVKRETGIQKGAHNAATEVVADLTFDQVLKITKMKERNLLGTNLKQKVKDIVGTCRTMGVTIDGQKPSEVTNQVNSGEFDDRIV